MSSQPEILTRAAVTDRCRELGSSQNGFAHDDRIWVKYGRYVSLAEADIQRYVHERADPSIVRIPKVFDAFETSFEPGDPIICIVMEYVISEDCEVYLQQHSTPAEEEKLMEAVVAAIQHIWTIPPPINAKPGPFYGRKPVDRFFSDCGSDQAFDDLHQLEQWINHKLQRARSKHQVFLQGERLLICHCDLSPFNILVSEPITIIDWGFSGIYPKCFDEFAICHQFTLEGQNFARALYKQIFGPELSERMRALLRAATYILCGR